MDVISPAGEEEEEAQGGHAVIGGLQQYRCEHVLVFPSVLGHCKFRVAVEVLWRV